MSAVGHRLLERQLGKLGLAPEISPSLRQWQSLLERVRATYAEADEDRYLLERSLSISSREMRELTQNLLSVLERRVAERTEELAAARCRLKAQERTLVELTRVASLQSDNLQSEFRQITAGSAQTLGVERVSIWQFNAERTAIVCSDLYEAVSGQHSAGALLKTSDFPAYVAAISESDVVAADDAQHDPRTSELAVPYLESLNITSMMDIPIRVRGQTVGVLCHEHIGPPRLWQADEQSFAVAVASLAALAIVGNERLQALHELEKARLAAEEATRTKSRFLASVSHEIRTPLYAIVSMAELLHETPLLEGQQEYVQTLSTASETLLALINETLDFSKIEAGKLELEATEFDLWTLIEGAFDLLAPKAQAKSLDLGWVVGQGVPRCVRSDPTRLRQILVNLLDNAVKFTAQGGVAVTVEWEVESPGPPGAGVLYLTVRDSGIGIPADRLAAIFQPFSQVDTSTTREFGGTGLGLAIVERLSELMGGSISVTSEVGQGSLFRVGIRAASVALDPQELFLRDLRVLVHSASPLRCRCLVEQVQHWGGKATVAATADQLAAELQGADPVAVLLFEGECLATQASEAIAATAVPKIHLGIRQGARFEGPQSYGLTLPVKPSQLRKALRQAVGLKAEEHGPAAAAVSPPSSPPTLPTRILLVEDNPVNRLVAVRILASLGYRDPRIAVDGNQALALLQQETCDVVLLDLHMPGLDGIETSRRIRKMYPQGDRPTVIAVTADTTEAARSACLAAGMAGVLIKPFRKIELQHCLEQHAPQHGPR